MSSFPDSFVQPWKQLLLSDQQERRMRGSPDYFCNHPDSFVTTSLPRSFHLGTGRAIFERALLPALLSARHSINFVTCYWAKSPSLDSLGQTLVNLARARPPGSPTLEISIGFSSSGLFQKLFHTASPGGRLYPPSEWATLGLPSQQVLARAGVQLTVKSLFFTPFSVMHPKYVLIDGSRAWIPSCNVSWEAWLEGCVEVEGQAVQNLVEFHRNVWHMGDTSTVSPTTDMDRQAAQTITSPSSAVPGLSSPTRSIALHCQEPVPTVFLPSRHHRNPRFRFFPFLSQRDPPMTHLNAALLTLFANAHESITVSTPNVTSQPVIDALLEALTRGVDVTICTSKNMMVVEQLVTAGTLTSWCLARMVKNYKALVRAAGSRDVEQQPVQPGKLSIFYYKPMGSRVGDKDEPVLSHFKMTLVDDQYVVLGSGNMDRASWWTSQEIGMLFYLPQFEGYETWQAVWEERAEVFYRSRDLNVR